MTDEDYNIRDYLPTPKEVRLPLTKVRTEQTNTHGVFSIEEDLYRPPQTRQGTPCHVRIIKTERPNASVCIPESLRGDNQNDR